MKFFTNSAWIVVATSMFSMKWAVAETVKASPPQAPSGVSTAAGDAKDGEPDEDVVGETMPDAADGDVGENEVDVGQGGDSVATYDVAPGVAETQVSEKERVLGACIAHHEKAQLARLSGGFLEALRELSACASPECPRALRSDCLTWRSEVDALTPTVIVVAEDDLGDVEAARVVVDGVEVRKKLDGRPIPLDPGTHLLRLELPNGEAKEQRLVLSEGERSRRVFFTFRSPRSAEPAGVPLTQRIRPVPPGVYILGATAFTGLGIAIGFGSDAYSKSRRARDLCAPLCDAEVSRAVSERAAVADVALGVAVASTIGAVVVYAYRPERVVLVDSVALDYVPEVGGGGVALRGAFQ